MLKPGQSLHHVVEPFVVEAAAALTKGRLYDAGVPAARFDEEGTIEGFVFWLDALQLDAALRVLDDLEDEGERYRRVVVEARTDRGSVEAFAYEFLDPIDGRPHVGSSWPG